MKFDVLEKNSKIYIKNHVVLQPFLVLFNQNFIFPLKIFYNIYFALNVTLDFFQALSRINEA